MAPLRDLTGERFDKLTVVERIGSQCGHALWKCRCDCGNISNAISGHLTRGKTKQCWQCAKRAAKRSDAVRLNPAYKHWQSIKFRTVGGWAPIDGAHHMCSRWRRSSRDFMDDIGPKPGAGYTVDRIDNNGHYSCGKCEECLTNGWQMNCRWATKDQQSANRSDNHLVTFRGETKPLFVWVRELGLNYDVIKSRLYAGRSPEDAFTTPVAAMGRRGPRKDTRVNQGLTSCWRTMLDRCGKRNRRPSPGYENVSVDERWLVFENFAADMGAKPFPGASLDRIDVRRGYGPDNCRWATKKQQARNRRNTIFVTVDGVTRSLGEWAEISGINYQTLRYRLAQGWSDILRGTVKRSNA